MQVIGMGSAMRKGNAGAALVDRFDGSVSCDGHTSAHSTVEGQLAALKGGFHFARCGGGPRLLMIRAWPEIAVQSTASDALQNLVGQQNARHGIIKIFNALQEHKANKHLLYVLMEVLLVELCPEVRTHLEQLKAGTACDSTK